MSQWYAVAAAGGRERAQGAHQPRRDRVILVVAAVHRRARVVRHGQPAHARPYVRAQGQVISLDVLPGEVRAMVQGSRARPYRITIGLAAFPELVWAKAEIALSEQALPSAKLLAGEVPPELESSSPPRARRCSRVGLMSSTCDAAARTGRCHASISRRRSTCWPRPSTTIPF